MIKKIIYLFLVLFVLPMLTIQAQDISTASIQWNSSSIFEAHTGNTVNENTTITTSNGHIVWKTTDGTVKYDFDILETNGSWVNVNQDGSIIFEVDNNANRGIVEFQRKGNGTIARIILPTDSNQQTFELTIDNFQLL